ncbi:hypothetical protein ACT691_20200 [Vibrio metschnikovii]
MNDTAEKFFSAVSLLCMVMQRRLGLSIFLVLAHPIYRLINVFNEPAIASGRVILKIKLNKFKQTLTSH